VRFGNGSQQTVPDPPGPPPNHYQHHHTSTLSIPLPSACRCPAPQPAHIPAGPPCLQVGERGLSLVHAALHINPHGGIQHGEHGAAGTVQVVLHQSGGATCGSVGGMWMGVWMGRGRGTALPQSILVEFRHRKHMHDSVRATQRKARCTKVLAHPSRRRRLLRRRRSPRRGPGSWPQHSRTRRCPPWCLKGTGTQADGVDQRMQLLEAGCQKGSLFFRDSRMSAQAL
jgi:hypothetical protein